MPDLEGVGEIVAGAAAARAIEPRAGEGAEGHTHERQCLNCGCELTGDFCHCCGQRAHVHRTIAAWWHDFLHSVLHLDGKFWRTLPMLALRPGELTRRYAHGERAKFISPLALFLFTVFLMFGTFSILGPDLTGDFGLGETVQQGLQEERQKLSELQQERSEIATQGKSTAEIDARITAAQADIQKLQTLQQQGVSRAVLEEDAEIQASPTIEAAYKKAKANPELLLYKLQANAYKFSWALIPISVPFLWILFVHRRRYRREFTAYDHLVFVTYSITFMSLALVVFVLADSAGLDGAILNLAIMLVPPVHMYLQLRGAYRLSRFSALWRTFVLLIFATVSLALFAGLLLLLGVLS